MMMIDSRGKQSTTLTFVTIAFIAALLKFAFGGLLIPMLGELPMMSGGEFAAAIAAILGIWTAREYKEKDVKNE